jgi:hypothetical protein
MEIHRHRGTEERDVIRATVMMLSFRYNPPVPRVDTITVGRRGNKLPGFFSVTFSWLPIEIQLLFTDKR